MDILQYFYALAVGFTLASLLVQGYRIMLGRMPEFGVFGQQGEKRVLSFPVLMFAGPRMLFSASISRFATGSGPLKFGAVGLLLSALWSLLSGIVVIQLVFLLTNSA